MTAAVMTIHVIDSELKFRRLIMGALEPLGVNFIQGTSLREADLELQVAHPDLIILDCKMSDGDGLSWLQSQRKKGLKTPVIFINSGSHNTEYFAQFLSIAGVKAVLHKPVTADAVRQVFLKHFAQSQPASESKSSPDVSEIEREIKELSLEYARELPERFQLLIRQVEDIKLGRGEPGIAKNEAHKIKGTASSYGYPAVGEQAEIIDTCLKELGEKPESASPELLARLEQALVSALQLAEEARDNTGPSQETPAVYDMKQAMSQCGLPAAHGQTVVIIDDDEDFTARVSLILGYEDMLVYSFNDARYLDEILGYLHADLLILDLNMPEMNGFEVCKRLRCMERFRLLPIVVLTAQTGWETRVAAFDSGADDYIPKPVVNQELIARIRVRAEKSRLQDIITSQSSVNKLLWQSLLLVLLQQEENKPV